MTFEQAWEAWWPTHLNDGWTVGDRFRFKAGWEAAQAVLSLPSDSPSEAEVEAAARRFYEHNRFPNPTWDDLGVRAREWYRSAVREVLTSAALSRPSDKTVELLREGWRAAVAFIECHAADPDITAEMAENYARYREAFKRIDSHLGGAK